MFQENTTREHTLPESYGQTKINDEQKEDLQRPITQEEVFKSLKQGNILKPQALMDFRMSFTLQCGNM